MKNPLCLNVFIMAILCLPLFGKAQHIEKISGRVTDVKGEPLMGNAILLSPKDSSFISGTSFLEGDFEVTDVKMESVILKLTSLQFADTLFYLKYTGNPNIMLGTINTMPGVINLDEVEVVGELPLFTSKPDGIVEVNVANTVLATSNSVEEILTRSPNLIVNEGEISLFGKGDAIIYMNGQRITNERLKSISPFQIKKIEIISNPSAKYEAEGNAVINIITKANTDEGYNIGFSQFVTMSEFAGTYTNTNININYRKKRYSVLANYDLQLGESRDLFNTTRFRPAPEEFLNSQVHTDRDTQYENVSNYNLGVTYDINDNSYLSLEYGGFYENETSLANSQNNLKSNTETSLYKTIIDREDLNKNNSLTLNYNMTLDTLGSSLFVGAQYSEYDSEAKDDINEDNVVNELQFDRLRISDLESKITIFSPQVDFVKALSKGRKLELGARFGYVKNKSDLDFYNSTDGTNFTFDQQRSNDFEYLEVVPAVYANFSGNINGEIKYGLGLRTEWTDYDLTTSVDNQGVIGDSYVNLFPNFYMNTNVSESVHLYTSYSSRITRPRYQSLNPFLIYQDAFTSIEGNPNLQPMKTHAFEIGSNYKKFDLKVGYNYTIDPIDAAALRGNTENSYVLKGINLNKGHSFFGSLSHSINNNWWSSTNVVNVSYNKLIDKEFNFTLTDVKPQVYLYSNNRFNVNGLFKIQALLWYLGEKYYGLYYDKSRSSVTFGVEKSFFNNSMTFKALANDIFHKAKPAGDYEVGRTVVLYDRLFNTDYYRLILTYNFGRLKKNAYKNRATGTLENRRAN